MNNFPDSKTSITEEGAKSLILALSKLQQLKILDIELRYSIIKKKKNVFTGLIFPKESKMS